MGVCSESPGQQGAWAYRRTVGARCGSQQPAGVQAGAMSTALESGVSPLL